MKNIYMVNHHETSSIFVFCSSLLLNWKHVVSALIEARDIVTHLR